MEGVRRSLGRWEGVALAAILLVATALRFVALGHDSIWSDEAVVLSLAHQDGPAALLRHLQVVDATRAPLHPLLLQGWIAVFGTSESAARALSAACGVATVALVYLLGRQTYGGTVGLWAAWLIAISPIDVYHAREVRMYALLVLATCTCWALLFSFRRSAPISKQVAFALALIALVYTHPLGGLMVLALGVGYLATRPESRLSGRRWVLIHIALSLALLPWIARYLDHPPETLNARLTPWHVLEWPEMFTGGRAEAVWAGAAVIAWGLWARRVGDRPEVASQRVDLALLAWFFLPVGLLLAYSLLRHPVFGPRRYLLYVGPAYLLLMARGLAALPRTPRYALALVGAVVAGSVMGPRVFRIGRPDWRGAAALIRQHDPQAPILIIDRDRPTQRACLAYYLDPSARLIPALRHVEELATSAQRPEPSAWQVIEMHKGKALWPVPEPLERLYVAEREWHLRSLRLVYTRLRTATTAQTGRLGASRR
ncbi:MAG: glycosyltransferase family 39 protein [Isosphaeraceae bacterium]|nr:glycosyltransferase family 39 protein [Isosphaeraceae bacterium]